MSELTKVDRCPHCGSNDPKVPLWGYGSPVDPWHEHELGCALAPACEPCDHFWHSSPVPEGPAPTCGLVGSYWCCSAIGGETHDPRCPNAAPVQPSPVVQTPESEVAKAERILWEIAKKINSLEGLPVDFGLTRRLSELLRGITESVNQPAPVVPVGETKSHTLESVAPQESVTGPHPTVASGTPKWFDYIRVQKRTNMSTGKTDFIISFGPALHMTPEEDEKKMERKVARAKEWMLMWMRSQETSTDHQQQR